MSEPRKTKTKRPKTVLVHWLDAHDETDTWVDVKEIEKDPCIITSIGFVIENGKPNHLTLAQSYSDELLYNNIIYIPNGMVVDTTIID